jgi:16S rRNA U1498 N3-methylase RsmE
MTPPLPLSAYSCSCYAKTKVLNRVIQHAASMGIKEIFIIKTWRVEKSYLESPVLDEDNLRIQMIMGLEQVKIQ